jgi:threonine aldolase
MIDYRSDNTGRAAPQILEALLRANHDTALGYGADEWTASLQQRFSELFETTVRVFPVATGTAANALALASLGPSWGIVYCSEVAHINTAEANATGSAPVSPLSGANTARAMPICSPRRGRGSRRLSFTEAGRLPSA